MNVNSVLNADGTFIPVEAEQNTSTAGTYFSNYMNQTSQGYGNYLEQIFQKASDTYHVSKDLLKAMAKAESNFRADATSHCGAMGIMQLMPATAASLALRMLTIQNKILWAVHSTSAVYWKNIMEICLMQLRLIMQEAAM